eukprot:3788193-Prymnesium_polylepis.2
MPINKASRSRYAWMSKSSRSPVCTGDAVGGVHVAHKRQRARGTKLHLDISSAHSDGSRAWPVAHLLPRAQRRSHHAWASAAEEVALAVVDRAKAAAEVTARARVVAVAAESREVTAAAATAQAARRQRGREAAAAARARPAWRSPLVATATALPAVRDISNPPQPQRRSS